MNLFIICFEKLRIKNENSFKSDNNVELGNTWTRAMKMTWKKNEKEVSVKCYRLIKSKNTWWIERL